MKVCLIGNQNSGKTTLFNLLTGLNQKVGNWPGVTVERKSGIIKNTDHELVDLPGIYSLSPYTSEENISRNFLLEDNPDVVINILDSTSLERSLYLTTQLLELDTRVIIALNMDDLLEKKGLVVDDKKLSEKLGCSVIKISALKKTGIDELIKAIDDKKEIKENKIYDKKIEDVLADIESKLSVNNKRFIAVKLLENDPLFENNFLQKEIKEKREYLECSFNTEIVELIASQRYDFIVELVKTILVKKKSNISPTDKLDKVFLNKWLSIPIFIVVMFLVYFLSVGLVGGATVEFIDGTVIGSLKDWLSESLPTINASPWAVSLVVDGMVTGVGAVLNFIPQLIILFLLISLLETSGYLSRVSFLLDKLFKRFGLSGKSIIPFIVGSGCSVPAIMTTRTIEDENEKKLTILLTPFIPCSAKLPIISLFAGYFFADHSGLVSASMYFLSIVVILVSAILLRKFRFKGESTSYISELPEYKIPSPRYVLRDVFDKTIAFIKRAGSIILLSSIIIWFLSSFNWKFQYGLDADKSILASIGRIFSWLFYPMLGENSWGAAVAAIQGLVAKENVVSTMEVISAVGEGGDVFAGNGLFAFFNPVNSYAFMVFNLFSAPCFGAIGAMRREFGSTKSMFKAVGFQTGLAWILASLIGLIGGLFI